MHPSSNFATHSLRGKHVCFVCHVFCGYMYVPRYVCFVCLNDFVMYMYVKNTYILQPFKQTYIRRYIQTGRQIDTCAHVMLSNIQFFNLSHLLLCVCVCVCVCVCMCVRVRACTRTFVIHCYLRGHP